MAQQIVVSPTLIPPGAYAYEILAPARANGARITISRAADWPAGDMFQYHISERQRTGVLRELMSATESGTGGPLRGKGGVVNPPLVIRLTWPLDADRDLIRFEVTVLQPFVAGITMEFA